MTACSNVESPQILNSGREAGRFVAEARAESCTSFSVSVPALHARSSSAGSEARMSEVPTRATRTEGLARWMSCRSRPVLTPLRLTKVIWSS